MFVTQILKQRYPRDIGDGLSLRPMEAADEKPLVEFFQRIPVDERRLFKDDVTQLEVIQGWVRNLNHENILPLLVHEGSKIIGDATLHRDRRGWARHVGKIRITLDPDHRGRGLAKRLVQEFIELALALGIAILQAEILDVQKGARALFEDLGFQSVATLPEHAIDFMGRVHDIVVWTYTVTPPSRLAPEASLREEDGDIGGH